MKTKSLFKIVFLSLLYVFYLSIARAQNPINPELVKYFGVQDSGLYEHAEKIIQTTDGHLVIAGQWQDSAWVMKLTSCGDQVWNKRFESGTSSGLKSVIELPGGNLAATGYCIDCAPGDPTYKAHVMLLDEGGNLLRDTTLGNFNFNSQGYDLTFMKQGNIAVTGFANNGGFLTPSNVIAAIFDPALNIITYHEINKTYCDFGNSIIATQDSGLVIVGSAIDVLFGPSYGLVMKLNSNADSIWVKKYTCSNSIYHSIAEKQNGDLVTAGVWKVDSIQNNDAYFTIVNGVTGTISARHNFGSTANDEAHQIMPISTGFLVGGTYGQPSNPNWNTRDWVFKLDTSFVDTTVAFYDSYLFAHHLNSIVALSPGGEDLAFVSNYNFFYLQDVFFVKRKQNGKEIVFSSAPMDFQLYPRDTFNTGTILWTGVASSANLQYDSLKVEIRRNDVLVNTLSQSLNFAGGVAPFSFSSNITAELAGYTFNLYGRAGMILYPEAEACEVVAGDAYIITGQSNAVAGIKDSTMKDHANFFVRSFGLRYGNDTVYIWHREKNDNTPMYDNRSGQLGLVMGDHIVNDYQVPVAILNGGIGGITLNSMFPDPSNHYNDTTSYGKFLIRTVKAGLKDKFRGLLFFQGESNAAGGQWNTVTQYKNKFETLYDAWASDYLGREMNYLFQIRPGCYWAGANLYTCQPIEEAHRQIADDYSDFKIMSATGMNHDSTHYYYTNGYERGGNDIYRLVARDLYDTLPLNNITPPNYDAIWFSDSSETEITIQMRDSDDVLNWTQGWENDFFIERPGPIRDSIIISGSVSGNRVILQLSSPPTAPFTGLSFASHPGGDECSVKNQNGIGMLCFYNAPVDPFVVGIQKPVGPPFSLTVYPNPTSGETINASWSGDLSFPLEASFYDMKGNRIKETIISNEMEDKKLSLNLPQSQGVFILELVSANGERVMFRVVKL